tara:strand:- start:4991 stop:5275 length:285 start_codon:yes stop_codon:yes gene_type:complete
LKRDDKPAKTTSIYTILFFLVLGTIAVLSIEPLYNMISYERTGDVHFIERQERFVSFMLTFVLPGALLAFFYVVMKPFLFLRRKLWNKNKAKSS